MPKQPVPSNKNKQPLMSPGELSLVLTATGLSPIALSRSVGISVKLFMAWWDGTEPIPMMAARLFRVMVLHPEVSDYFKEVRVLRFK